jgi:hypothetical protein
LVYHLSEWFSLIQGWRIDRDSVGLRYYLPDFGKDQREVLDLTSTIPYFGVESRLRGLKVTAVASPWLISSFREDYFTWDDVDLGSVTGTSQFRRGGYFLDISAEYSGVVADNLSLGFFASTQWLHGAYDLTWTGGGIYSAFAGYFDGDFWRVGWAVGGRMVLNFSLM